MASGGTYLRFYVGTRGAAGAHVAYISRTSAVRERGEEGGICGFVSQGIPDEIKRAETFEELRENLVLYAQMREEAEAKGRTHYRTLMSFETRTSGAKAAEMVREWLKTVLPGTRAIGFVNQNTEHTHAHVWIDARKADGKKLDLSPRAYRSLDEAWNRIYCRALGRDEREHLEKKRHGSHKEKVPQERERPVAPQPPERDGARQEGSVSAPGEAGAGGSPGRERTPAPGEHFGAEAARAFDQALRETEGLYRALAELARGADRERETERGRE